MACFHEISKSRHRHPSGCVNGARQASVGRETKQSAICISQAGRLGITHIWDERNSCGSYALLNTGLVSVPVLSANDSV